MSVNATNNLKIFMIVILCFWCLRVNPSQFLPAGRMSEDVSPLARLTHAACCGFEQGAVKAFVALTEPYVDLNLRSDYMGILLTRAGRIPDHLLAAGCY